MCHANLLLGMLGIPLVIVSFLCIYRFLMAIIPLVDLLVEVESRCPAIAATILRGVLVVEHRGVSNLVDADANQANLHVVILTAGMPTFSACAAVLIFKV